MQEKIKRMKEKLDRFGIIKTLVVIIIALIIFQAGMFVGYGKAMFYRSLGDRYYKPFDQKHGPNDQFGGFNSFVQDSNLPGGHGAVGKIVSINLPNIVVASPDNIEKTINISNDTLIRHFRDNIGAKDLQVGDYIIVLGDTSSSDNGIVNAKLIRLLPPPPSDLNPQQDANQPIPSNPIPPDVNPSTSSPSNSIK
ncbi:MAG: hypothetical protein WCO09_03880 [bacterium]